MVTVTSTKKLKPGLVAAARAEGFFIQDHDFIQVRPVWSAEKQETFNRLLAAATRYVAVTSAHAMESLERYMPDGSHAYRNWKIFCLSGRTRESVADFFHGSGNIIADADNAQALAQKIMEQKVRDLVFLCGNLRREELPRTLQAAGIRVHELVVYETVLQPVVAPAADAVLFFSPSAVESFFSVNQLKPNTICFAIGATTAGAIGGKTANTVVLPAAPSQEAVIASLYLYFKNKKQKE